MNRMLHLDHFDFAASDWSNELIQNLLDEHTPITDKYF